MSGILLVDKPKGWTSNDVCQFLKKRFQFKKVGHGGTLDPFATGLLVLYLDDSTRLTKISLNDMKIYEGVIRLGAQTSTGDSEGSLIATEEISSELNLQAIQSVFDSFLGPARQKPPMTSAIKKNGIPLYRLARKGIEIEREDRDIEIFELKVLSWDKPFISFTSKVSKGTYVRVLAEDIGTKLGTKAHLRDLRRIASGKFNIENAISMDRLKEFESKEEINPHLLNESLYPCV